MYGLNDKRTADFGRKCLITRRLLEKGVRFVQLYSGGGHLEDTWDGHNDCIGNHTLHAGETDQPIAALIADLKRTGPVGRDAAGLGRRVRPHADERRRRQAGPRSQPVRLLDVARRRRRQGRPGRRRNRRTRLPRGRGRCHVSDLHATILHLMGLDHAQADVLLLRDEPAAHRRQRECGAKGHGVADNSSGWHFNVLRDGGWLRNGVTMGPHTLQMKLDRLPYQALGLFDRVSSRYAAGEIWRIGAVTRIGLLNHDSIALHLDKSSRASPAV